MYSLLGVWVSGSIWSLLLLLYLTPDAVFKDSPKYLKILLASLVFKYCQIKTDKAFTSTISNTLVLERRYYTTFAAISKTNFFFISGYS